VLDLTELLNTVISTTPLYRVNLNWLALYY